MANHEAMAQKGKTPWAPIIPTKNKLLISSKTSETY